MFKSYLTTALRSLQRHKLFSLINVTGLAIGISASLVIYLLVQFEFSFDTFHKDRSRIYRLVTEIEFPDVVINNSGVPAPTGPALREEVPGLDAVAPFMMASRTKVSVPYSGNAAPRVFSKEEQIVYADRGYFEILGYEWLAGSPSMALSEPFRVVLTESVMRKYFGPEPASNILGRTITYNDTIQVTVSGVVRDLQQPTDFQARQFISFGTINSTGLKKHWGLGDWGSINSSSQLLVRTGPKNDTAALMKSIAALRKKHFDGGDEGTADNIRHFLQPLSAIHFDPVYSAMGNRHAHKPTMYGLLAVASFLLLLGCINFINLTTAQAGQRAREIGIRKTMGGRKSQLIFQFLSETFFLTLSATVLSLLLTPFLLDIFSDFIPPEISLSSLNQRHVWIFLAGLTIAVTIFAGIYPAFMLSRFNPVSVLKNQFSSNRRTRSERVRKGLTVAQFVIAQFLVIATLVVGKQVHYSLNKELGYDKDAIVYFGTPWSHYAKEPDDRRFLLFGKLQTIPGIESISLADDPPASHGTSSSVFKTDNGKKIVEAMVETKLADSAYFRLYGIQLLSGRNLQQSDTTKEYVINEAYASLMGFPDPADAIGRFIEVDGLSLPVVGIVKDFHTKSTHEMIKPLAFSARAADCHDIHLRLSPRQADGTGWKETIAEVERVYREVYPKSEFNCHFFDESIAAFYKTEQNISRLLTWAAALCIFISCLGLLGLTIFITSARTKEVGVRKVLGASVFQLVSLLSRGIISLVFLAFLISFPLSWWAMNSWLGDFEYRTSLSWWIFALTGLGMLLICLGVLSLRIVRSASVNPVNSLRSE